MDLFTWTIIRSASQNSVAASGGALWGKVLLEISQNSQENTFAYVFFIIKSQAKVFFYRTPQDDCFWKIQSEKEFRSSGEGAL